MKNSSSPASTNTSNISKTLNVVVVDSNNNPTSGAKVSISPGDQSVVTNGAGEASFSIGSAAKYNITVQSGSNTVILPYYVTKDGATRMVVNPSYVKTVEAAMNKGGGSLSFVTSHIGTLIAVVVGIVVVYYLVKKLFGRK